MATGLIQHAQLVLTSACRYPNSGKLIWLPLFVQWIIDIANVEEESKETHEDSKTIQKSEVCRSREGTLREQVPLTITANCPHTSPTHELVVYVNGKFGWNVTSDSQIVWLWWDQHKTDMRIHINTTTGFALFLESSSSSLTILSSSTICPFCVAVCLQILLSRSSIDISSTKHRNYNGMKLSNLSIKRGGMRAFCKSMDWETADGQSRNSSLNISKTEYCAIQKKPG